MTDRTEKAIDALHAELTENERDTGNMLRTSMQSDAGNVPPMPDDLLDDVLSDLGVEQKVSAARAVREPGFLERCLELFRGKPLVFAGLVAAACVVAILAVNVGDDEGGSSGVRGGGTGGTVAEPPIVVFTDPSPKQMSAAQENFQPEHLRFLTNGEPVARDRARIVVDEGVVRAFRSGEVTAFLEKEAPADPQELIDLITELIHEFEVKQ
jgi:hypothetical protein